uniref:hypothetical protein n=1 Tax=Escherichia coli TaxID=562 RepID=UPI000F0A1159|nr:hypothetical protein [Escherichia coli]
MLPSETMIWQPEFTDKTLSRKPGAVQVAGTKKPPEGGFTTLLIALILFLSFPWYPERDLNPHSANAEGF